MSALLRPFLPAVWLAAYWYYCWAVHDMAAHHADLHEALALRDRYAGRLGIRGHARRPAFLPRHWNCRCCPEPLTPRRELPR